MKKIRWPVLMATLSLTALTFMYQIPSFAKEQEPEVHGSISVKGSKQSQFPSLAKIKPQEAGNLALQGRQGSVISVGLENEDGYLVYAVNVVSDSTGSHEILIDAGDGKVLADQSKNSKHHETKDEAEDD